MSRTDSSGSSRRTPQTPPAWTNDGRSFTRSRQSTQGGNDVFRIRKSAVLTVSLLAVVCFVGAGCTTDSSADAPDTAVVANDPSSRPGSAAVYARIESSTDCVALQREFDIAMANVESTEYGDSAHDISFGYANAADRRMQEVGCYG